IQTITINAQTPKDKLDNWDLLKIKHLCSSKDFTKKIKTEPTDWEKNFGHYKSDKGLISKIYEKIQHLYNKKTNNPIKQWAKEMNRPFTKEDIQMANRHMRKCSLSLAI
ncbi:hypothetical protein U6Z35_21445, partial [Bacillus subtilis]|uniref:hypothetical protein n=1 Tax=Bacillus subtilis TaxID=1423 RepID=UPI002ADEF59A